MELEQATFYFGDQVPKENVIYLIQTGDNIVKIGFATSLDDRLRECKRWAPHAKVLAAFPGTLQMEKALHAWIKPDHRIASETYDLTSLRKSYKTSRRLTPQEEQSKEFEWVVTRFASALQLGHIYDVFDGPIKEPYGPGLGYSNPPRGSVCHMMDEHGPCYALAPDGSYWSKERYIHEDWHNCIEVIAWLPTGHIKGIPPGEKEP